MGVLKKITEEYFKEGLRCENDVKFNTGKMVALDMGGSVLWADRDLEVESGGDYKYDMYFTGNEILDMKFENGWRVPVFDEYLELFDTSTGTKEETVVESGPYRVLNISFLRGDTTLKFETRGRYDAETPNELIFESFLFGRWSSDAFEDEDGLKKVNLINLYCTKNDIVTFKKDRRQRGALRSDTVYLPVRLVKDKNR